MWLLLPIKPLQLAKQRLRGLLTAAERAALAQAMAQDALIAAMNCREASRVVVLSGDRRVEAMARQHGAALLDESRGDDASLAQKIDHAIAQLLADGAKQCAIVHCDLPLLTAAELDDFLGLHRDGGANAMTIAPDRRRGGTNLLALNALSEYRAQYGADSFRRHCNWAARAGQEIQVCELPGTALDIDEPSDLRELALRSGTGRATNTGRYLVASGLIERVGPLKVGTALDAAAMVD